MSFQFFSVTQPAEYVQHIEINRPEKLNAFKRDMWLELRQVFNQASANPDVRAVILSGSGDRAFTAGLDLFAASEGPISGSAETETDVSRQATKLRRYIADFQECVTAIEACEKPVICVIHGIALGLAIDIASACDIRVCSADAKLAVKEVDIGLAADIGTLARLPKVVGNGSWVREVCLTGRPFDAKEALNVGLVSHVYPSKAATVAGAVELATLIASKSPVAVQGTKELLLHAREHSVKDNLRYTQVWNSAMLQSNDLHAAFLSGINKTKPTFEKL